MKKPAGVGTLRALRKEYEKYSIIFNQIINLQRETYEVMFRKGWYTLEKADTNKVSSKHQMLTQELNSL